MIKAFTSTLEVPKAWKALLDQMYITDTPCVTEAKPEALDENGNVKNDWPHPFQDDRRSVEFTEDGYTVILFLFSERRNYWLEALIVEPTGREHVCVRHGLDEDVMKVWSGEMVFTWKQKLV